jgi:hypothetical protein
MGDGAVGVVSIVPDANVEPTGVSGTGQIGSVNVWGFVDDSQTPSWSSIDDAQTPSWTSVSDTQTPDWKEVA